MILSTVQKLRFYRNNPCYYIFNALVYVRNIATSFSDLGGFLDYHISYGLEERPKNIVNKLMDFDFSGSDEDVRFFPHKFSLDFF